VTKGGKKRGKNGYLPCRKNQKGGDGNSEKEGDDRGHKKTPNTTYEDEREGVSSSSKEKGKEGHLLRRKVALPAAAGSGSVN